MKKNTLKVIKRKNIIKQYRDLQKDLLDESEEMKLIDKARAYKGYRMALLVKDLRK